MRPRTLVLLLLLLALPAAVAVAVVARTGDASPRDTPSADAGPYRGSEPPALLRMVPFALRDQDGVLVRSRDLLGSAVALTFLDTQCREACPVVAGMMADALDQLPAGAKENVVAVAISVDPREDTPASVRRFLRRNRATDKLRYLVGPLERLEPVWKGFQILSSHESGDDAVHSAPVRVYDAEGVWVSSLHAGVDLTPANLAHDLRTALARGKEPK